MPRIYKPVGPTSNKATGPSETKTPAAPEVKKPEVKKTETGGEKQSPPVRVGGPYACR